MWLRFGTALWRVTPDFFIEDRAGPYWGCRPQNVFIMFI
jgi:hypothetical protein